jgi:hypothetical protein
LVAVERTMAHRHVPTEPLPAVATHDEVGFRRIERSVSRLSRVFRVLSRPGPVSWARSRSTRTELSSGSVPPAADPAPARLDRLDRLVSRSTHMEFERTTSPTILAGRIVSRSSSVSRFEARPSSVRTVHRPSVAGHRRVLPWVERARHHTSTALREGAASVERHSMTATWIMRPAPPNRLVAPRARAALGIPRHPAAARTRLAVPPLEIAAASGHERRGPAMLRPLRSRSVEPTPMLGRPPVARIHRAAPEPPPLAPPVEAGLRTSPIDAQARTLDLDTLDLDTLGRDLWRRFERQLRVEQERRGRR